MKVPMHTLLGEDLKQQLRQLRDTKFAVRSFQLRHAQKPQLSKKKQEKRS